MPVVSGSPTQIATSQLTKAALSGTPSDQFKSGDQGFCASEFGTVHGALYVLLRATDVAGLPAVNGTTVLSVYQQPADRWVSLSIVGAANMKEEVFTALAGQTVFPLAGAPNGKTILAVNGVIYEVGLSYTLTLIAGVWTVTWLDTPFVMQAGWTVAVYYV